MILYMRKKKPEVSYLFLEVYYAILQNWSYRSFGCWNSEKKSDVFYEFADNMQSLSQTFYIKSDKKDYVFAISTGNNNVIYFGAIINERGNIKSVLDNYMKLCNFKTEYNSIEEQVFDRLRDNLRIAEYSNFIRDDEDLTEKFGITPLLNQHGFNSLKYGETLLN